MYKTWQAARKRLKVTKNKKILKKKTGQNHFNTKERGKTVMGKRRRIRAPHIATVIVKKVYNLTCSFTFMARVKRGMMHAKRRKNILKHTKGYTLGRKKLLRAAKQALLKAGAHAYRDRRKKKRDFRALWNIQINAAARQHGFTYATLMDQLKKKHIALDRKILADLGEHHPIIFKALVEKIR